MATLLLLMQMTPGTLDAALVAKWRMRTSCGMWSKAGVDAVLSLTVLDFDGHFIRIVAYQRACDLNRTVVKRCLASYYSRVFERV